MHSALVFSGLSALALVRAQSEATPNPTIPTIPTSTDGIPTIEGALVYDGPPVVGYTGPGGNATVQTNNPAASYVATLPSVEFDTATGTTITGTVTATTPSDGTGVSFSISFSGFPSVAEYGPFVYHIHEFAVPADGNCSATVAHLDPTNRGELHACEAPAPQTCQAGDLAGKHGNITATTWNVQYTDLYLSTNPSSPYYFGDKSIVIHSSNATRLTCANFVQSSSSTSNATSPAPTGGSTGSTGSNLTTTGSTPSGTAFVSAGPSSFGVSMLAATGLAALVAVFML